MLLSQKPHHTEDQSTQDPESKSAAKISQNPEDRQTQVKHTEGEQNVDSETKGISKIKLDTKLINSEAIKHDP